MRILQMTGKVWKLAAVVFILLSSYVYAQGIKSMSYIKSNPDGSQTLLNHVPKVVALGSTSLISHASSNQMLDLRIMLPSKDQAGLDSFIQQLYDPKSPNYHKFLTPQQFDQEFGASTVDSTIVIAHLKSQGFTVKSQSKSGFIISVAGTVSAVEPAFKVKINNYRKMDGTLFFSTDSNPTLPTQIAGKVYAIVGLENVTKFYPHYHLKNPPVTAKIQTLITGAKPSLSTAVSPAFSGHGGFLGPSDITTAYNLNSLASNGSGQTIALYELDGYVTSDITTFEAYYGLPHTPLTNVYTDGATGGTPGVNSIEDVLDIDLAVAVSPGLSNIRVYEAPNTSSGWIDQWDQIATDNVAKVISVSWGSYEASSYPFYDHTVFSELAAQGQTVFASAGDAGAYDNCDGGSLPSGSPPTCTIEGISGGTPILSVDDPASDPYITSAGISVLTANSNGSYNSETGSLYGGGGISSYWSIPTFQQGLTLAPGSLVSTTMRNVPDVSFTADPATSYGIYASTAGVPAGWYGVWGSSAASPIWASFMIRVNQGRAASGASVVGDLNPLLYEVATFSPSIYANDFHDISTGNNSFYPAKTGYDDATGLGSFNGANLYNDLVVPSVPTTTATASNHQVSLSWTASTGATSYKIFRATTSQGENLTLPLATTSSTSYLDTGLTDGTTYYYEVYAYNEVGLVTLNPAAEVSATPFVPTVPSAPLGAFAVAGNAQATVSFSPPASNGGSPVLSYTVTSIPPGGISAPGPSSPITVTGLTNGMSYTFTVIATNIVGPSVPSAPSNSVTPSPVASPSSLNGTILAAKVGSQILYGGTSLTWKQSVGPGILQNKIYRAAGAGSYTLIATLGATTSYTDKNLTKGIIYKYEVTAVSSLGESPPSNVWTVNY